MAPDSRARSGSRPASARTSVDLPEPLSPMIARISPEAMSSDTPESEGDGARW